MYTRRLVCDFCQKQLSLILSVEFSVETEQPTKFIASCTAPIIDYNFVRNLARVAGPWLKQPRWLSITWIKKNTLQTITRLSIVYIFLLDERDSESIQLKNMSTLMNIYWSCKATIWLSGKQWLQYRWWLGPWAKHYWRESVELLFTVPNYY